MTDKTTAPRLPLDGLRVIDLTRVLSGPYCSMMLGDMGAEVLKIETPQGDPVRAQGTIRDGLSWYFASFNRNKKSVVLDLYTEAGRAALARLLADADVLLENYRPGVLEKMGFGKERLQQINPRLVTASINGFGSTGPYVERPAFDFIAQAMSGLMATNGPAGGEPMRMAQPITDLLAGVYCAFGVVTALRGRDLNGNGQHVEAAMVNGAMSTMAYLAAEYFATGAESERTGNDHPLVAPYGLFQAADGKIAIAPSNDTILRRLLDALDLGHLMSDERFDTNAKRFACRDVLHRLLDERLVTDTQDAWITRLNAAGVPCGRVQSLSEAFEDPQIVAQEMAIEVDHPGHGPVRMLGFPVKLDKTPCTPRLPAPELGAHTHEVLQGAGFTAEEIADLTGATEERRSKRG
ncbi:CoA transferase [Aquicoccus sp. SU-CL01552]|uniref:CaiB/BaiF CoA transferase family protein n=1 Tax=Aquicoccus sp. SU-CL01552 TaxID=3127656 RepID=UPI003103168A